MRGHMHFKTKRRTCFCFLTSTRYHGAECQGRGGRTCSAEASEALIASDIFDGTLESSMQAIVQLFEQMNFSIRVMERWLVKLQPRQGVVASAQEVYADLRQKNVTEAAWSGATVAVLRVHVGSSKAWIFFHIAL